ncbi:MULTISPECIES: Hsp20/alpha crystallin family protein [unclassified Paenibacillus]|uniref:Hsp20/alpha crystallin family protein n=1 Tax=unclassified Paenibacillus TaxID=185978 RepID=UPI00363A1CC1
MDKNNNPFSIFDWKKFEDSFGGLPQPSKEKNDGSTWVEQYVHDILKQSIPPLSQSAGTLQYNTEITETEHALLIKINIPSLTDARNIKTYVAVNQVKLEANDHDKLQLIRLPHPVIPTSCKAIYKNGILQLHIRKQSKDEQFYEVDVKYS